MNEFLSSLFKNKKQKVVWITYIIFVLLAIVFQMMDGDDVKTRLCSQGISELEGIKVQCGVNWGGIGIFTVFVGIIVKLLENSKIKK